MLRVLVLAALLVIPPAARAGGPCRVRSDAAIFARDTPLLSADGQPMAVFSGGATPATATLEEGDGRVRLTTTDGRAGLRLDGWVDRSMVPLRAARDLPIAGGALAIARGRRVDLVGVGPDGVRISYLPFGARDPQALTVPCAALTLSMVPAPPVTTRGEAVVTRPNDLELFDAPDGQRVFTLRMEDGMGQGLRALERRGDFVHVVGRADLVFDAWMRAADLQPDRSTPDDEHIVGSNTAMLRMLDREIGFRVASRPIPVRLVDDPSAPVIGTIEAGARYRRLGGAGGWVEVKPYSLGFVAPDGGRFWIEGARAR